MPARLFCKTGELAGSSFAIGDEAVIGRQSRNEITLHPSVVSGQHARIYYDEAEGCYVLEDLDSSNGTALDGVPVHEPERLGPLHVITLAEQLDFIFQILDEAPTAPPGAVKILPTPQAAPTVAAPTQEAAETRLGDPFAAAPATPPEPAQATRLGDAFAPLPSLEEAADTAPPATEKQTRLGDPFEAAPPATGEVPPEAAPVEPEKTRLGDPFAPLPASLTDELEDEPEGELEDEPDPPPKTPAPKHFALAITMPDGTAFSAALHDGENIVGREAGCDVVIRDPAVSRRHACLTVHDGTVHLRDLGSKNASFVAGVQLTQEVEVTPGTPLRFGLQVEAVVMARA